MQVILSENAEKEYNKLNKAIQAKIRRKLTELISNPLSGKKLAGDLKGMRSSRAWPYRIIYGINKAKDRIEIHKISHRQGVYK